MAASIIPLTIFNQFCNDTNKVQIFEKQVASKLQILGSCWVFTGCKDHKGYGYFRVGGRSGKNFRLHKWTWEAINGPMPENLQCDHVCRVRACCNPFHIEPVSPKVNTARGIGPGAINARKTHCPYGHEYTPENTRITYGRRRCRTCIRAAKRRKRLNERYEFDRSEA